MTNTYTEIEFYPEYYINSNGQAVYQMSCKDLLNVLDEHGIRITQLLADKVNNCIPINSLKYITQLRQSYYNDFIENTGAMLVHVDTDTIECNLDTYYILQYFNEEDCKKACELLQEDVNKFRRK